jgi:hypothetical protein
MRETTHWIESRGGAVSTSLNYGWLVEATLDFGFEVEARMHAARLFNRVRVHDRHGEAQGCRALAKAAARRGEASAARHYLQRADSAADFRRSPREQAVNALARAGVAVLLGQGAEARALLESAGEAFEGMKMAWHLGVTRETLRTL